MTSIMLLHYNLLLLFVLLSGVSCHIVKSPKLLGKQLFISHYVVTESEEFDGGVLVNEKGIIEAVLKKDSVDLLLQSESSWNLEIIDGGDWALLAGGVDSHVHVNEPGRTSWEGYVTATQAAAAGGITTIMDMPLNSIPATVTLENLKIKAKIAKEEIFVDVGFWGGVVPGNGDELQKMVKAGVVGFKCFLINSGVKEFPYVTLSDLDIAFKYLNGTGTVLAFHAELQVENEAECEGSACPNPVLYDTYLATRPDIMEQEAVSLIGSLVHKTEKIARLTLDVKGGRAVDTKKIGRIQIYRTRIFGSKSQSADVLVYQSVHMHVVHVSSAAVVPILEKAREERIKNGYIGWRGGITGETCNHYLSIYSEQIPPGHTEFKCAPPIRNNTNRQILWEYIRDGRLDLVASDHSPSTADLKKENFLDAWGGVSSVQFDLSLFWTEAKARGYGLNTLSHYLSAGPARLCGLQSKKGAIRPGLDADLIFFDPNASFIVTPEIIRYKNKISPYMNRVLTGKVMQTYVRGQLVYSEGELIGGPKGNILLDKDVI